MSSQYGDESYADLAHEQQFAGCTTIVKRLEQRLRSQPQHQVYSFLPDGDGISESLTFEQLSDRALAIAARLRQMASPGDRVLLLYPPGLDFISALFGCFVSGMIGVPACPPDLAGATEALGRLARIAANCTPAVVLAGGRNAERILGSCREQPSMSTLASIATGTIADDEADDRARANIDAHTPAFLQYTSGSTGDPRGVIITHDNIVQNITAMQHAFLRGSAGVSWLPHYHDMGLIGAILQAVWTGIPLYLLPPLLMLKYPHRWLQTISRYRAEICPAPNFAFDYCVRRVTQAQKASLDLSCWKVACVGAEPVRAETLRRFAEAFSPCGFRTEAFYPCYGLAEATLFVTGGQACDPPVIRRVSSSTTGQPPEEGGGIELVGCGRAAGGHEVVIVNPETLQPCPDSTVGEIWIRGPSVTRGYWNRPHESQEAFSAMTAEGQGPYLRSGDLGFIDRGELFITGRLKELIVIRGQNLYPADIEDLVARCHPAFEGRPAAAFGVWIDGEEQLVVVQEVYRQASLSNQKTLIEEIQSALSDQLQLRAHDIRLVRAGTLPKTTSGKIRRGECRDRYLNNSLVSFH